jgi:hypothetical protein
MQYDYMQSIKQKQEGSFAVLKEQFGYTNICLHQNPKGNRISWNWFRNEKRS